MLDVPKARQGVKGEVFKAEYEPEAMTDCKDLLVTVEAEFEEHLKACRKLLRKPEMRYITVAADEYLLEVRISEAKNVPADWLRINGTKSVYRYRSPEMTKLLAERDQAEERLAAEADLAFQQFLSAISAKYDVFRETVVQMSTLDCLISLSIVGLSPKYSKPTIVPEACLNIVAGRHPIVEQILDRPFIPNDIDISPDGLRAMVVTGCNMSGKSSFSRMVALLVIMNQIGCRLPCDSATMGLFDYVGTRFGASDELGRGRSVSALEAAGNASSLTILSFQTFMVELTETCEILKSSTPRSLIVLDELGRGTSTRDGQVIAEAVLTYIMTIIKASTLFITHYPQMAKVAAVSDLIVLVPTYD